MKKKKKDSGELPCSYRVRATEKAVERAGGWLKVLEGSFYLASPSPDEMPSRASFEAGEADSKNCFSAPDRGLLMIPYRDYDGRVIVLWATKEENWVSYMQPGVLPLLDCLGNEIDEAP